MRLDARRRVPAMASRSDVLERAAIAAGDVQRCAERDGLLDARHAAQPLGERGEVGAAHLPGRELLARR